MVGQRSDTEAPPQGHRQDVRGRCRLASEEIRNVVRKGLKEATDKLPGKSLKSAYTAVAAGKCESSPFPTEVVDKVRMDLRIALKRAGVGDGLPEEGDLDQHTEVRLLQTLLKAFGDPDHYFGEWWSKGVWLGSPDRKLPRAPALYERKTKWPKRDTSLSLSLIHI